MSHLDYSGVLIATATYNETNNIGRLITRIRKVCGRLVDILVVDDNSPDRTYEKVAVIQTTDDNLHLLHRESKLGLGSAQKAIVVYSIVHNYKKLIFLDADLSHRPEDIPRLFSKSLDKPFVIGSRYGDGGSTSMTEFRNMVSRTGNLAARLTIGTNLHEITTSFRVYDVDVLRTIPLYLIKTDCYAYFLESVFLLKQGGIELIEEPIYFDARENDTSKIPNFQIISSGFSLLKMIPGRFLKYKPGPSTEWWSTLVCPECGVGLSILRKKSKTNSLYHYISGIFTDNEARPIDTYECLNCGVIWSDT